MPNEYIRGRRRARMNTEWSTLNAKLGGVLYKEHPSCRMLQRYIELAPYGAPYRQWDHFRRWMQERVHHPLQLVR